MRLALLLVLLSGCATYTEIDPNNHPPSDWPNLREEIVYGSPEQVKGWCSKLRGLEPEYRGKVLGCALAYFEINLCRIYLTERDPAQLEHERMHCKGYVHYGEGDRAHRAMQNWKAKNKQ